MQSPFHPLVPTKRLHIVDADAISGLKYHKNVVVPGHATELSHIPYLGLWCRFVGKGQNGDEGWGNRGRIGEWKEGNTPPFGAMFIQS